MTQEALGLIADSLDDIGINYEFAEWSSEVPATYFIGEYQEEESITEDGMQNTTFILTGTTRGRWLELEQAKAKIEKEFENKTAIINHQGIAVWYSSSLPVPTDVEELKRIQINLKIKEWKVN